MRPVVLPLALLAVEQTVHGEVWHMVWALQRNVRDFNVLNQSDGAAQVAIGLARA